MIIRFSAGKTYPKTGQTVVVHYTGMFPNYYPLPACCPSKLELTCLDYISVKFIYVKQVMQSAPYCLYFSYAVCNNKPVRANKLTGIN